MAGAPSVPRAAGTGRALRTQPARPAPRRALISSFHNWALFQVNCISHPRGWHGPSRVWPWHRPHARWRGQRRAGAGARGGSEPLGPGPWAAPGPALQPAASWGFCKYLPNKETAAFAFPVIVALAPPPVGAGWGGPLPAPRPAGPRSGSRGPALPLRPSRRGDLDPRPDTGSPLLPLASGPPHPRNLRCPRP